jgi:hypothetical protein
LTVPIEVMWEHLTLGDKLQLIKLLREEGLI